MAASAASMEVSLCLGELLPKGSEEKTEEELEEDYDTTLDETLSERRV